MATLIRHQLPANCRRALEILPSHRLRMLLKLADVAHEGGDTKCERSLRQSIHGSLVAEYPER